MIIYIDPTDELNTIIRRIGNIEESNITVVFPEDCGAFHDRMFMQMIAEYAERWNKRVVIDSSDPVILKNACDVGLDVPESQSAAVSHEEAEGNDGEAKENGNDGPHAKSKKGGRLVERLLVIFLIVFASLALVYFAMPRAVVVVTPARHEFVHEVNLQLSDLNCAHLVEVTAPLTRRTPATGVRTVGIAKAVGEVILVNQSPDPVVVPRGTVVLTAGDTSFVTLEDVEVPAVSTQYFMDIPTGLQAGRAVANIEALVPGSKGNVAEGRIQHIVGFDLDVRNPEPTSGGVDTVLHIVTGDDISRGRTMVERDAGQLTLESLQDMDYDGELVLETLSYDLVWQDHTPIGEETDEVFVSAVAYGKAYALDHSALGSEIMEIVEKLTPPQRQVTSSSLQLGNLVVEGEPGSEILTVTVTGQSQSVIDREKLATGLLGQSVDSIADILSRLPDVAGIEVPDYTGESLPRWRRWITIEVADFVGSK